MARIHHMTVTRYQEDGWTHETDVLLSPSWEEVERVLRNMHDFHQPLVTLMPSSIDDDPDGLMICGGFGRWVIHDVGGTFRYVADPSGGEEEVEVWRSDQGFVTAARYVMTDVDRVLRVVRAYYLTGTCRGLDEVP